MMQYIAFAIYRDTKRSSLVKMFKVMRSYCVIHTWAIEIRTSAAIKSILQPLIL